MAEGATPTALRAESQGGRPRKGLAARVVGVIVSPAETYTDIAAHPRALSVLVLVFVATSLVLGVFLSTDTGRNAALDQNLSMMEAFGSRLSEAQMRQVTQSFEARAAYAPLYAVGGILVGLPLTVAVVAGLGMLVFNVGLGGEATFRQMFAIVAYSRVISLLQTLFVTPLNFARESLSSATSLLVFFPMIDDAGFLGRLLGWIDLFRIWWIASLAIGLGVLYKRGSWPIAAVILALYVLFALAAAGVMVALTGA
jgi:Yip1-like protein